MPIRNTIVRPSSWAMLGCASVAISACTASPSGSNAFTGSDESGAADDEDDGDDGGLRLDVGGGGTTMGRDPDDTRDVPVREEECVDGVCTCLRLALLGSLDSAALEKDTQPFVDWLNSNSAGTATVEMITTKPSLTEEWLEDYDILVVANVNAWTFGADELEAVERWSRETGGGIVALTGFVSTDQEPAATSALIEFSGMRFVGPQKTAENGQSVPVYYDGDTTTNLKDCLAWTGSSAAIITAPIAFEPQDGSMSKLTHELDYVGAFTGWAVEASEDATVVATDPVSGRDIAAAREVDEAGRVFAFGDEWVIFANQWEPVGDPHNRQEDAYNRCWHAAEGGEPGFHHSVASLYQTRQFWFNAISWVAPPNECGFIIIDDQVDIP